jgi:hypothetical protein
MYFFVCPAKLANPIGTEKPDKGMARALLANDKI